VEKKNEKGEKGTLNRKKLVGRGDETPLNGGRKNRRKGDRAARGAREGSMERFRHSKKITSPKKNACEKGFHTDGARP